MTAYIITGIGFVVATVLLSWYVTGYGMKSSAHISIGLKAIFLSYVLGAAALFAAIAAIG